MHLLTAAAQLMYCVLLNAYEICWLERNTAEKGSNNQPQPNAHITLTQQKCKIAETTFLTTSKMQNIYKKIRITNHISINHS